MVELSEFIQIYDNSLDKETCDFLIKIFEDSSDIHENSKENHIKNIIEFDITKNINLNENMNKVHDKLIATAFSGKRTYYEFVNKNVFPETHAFEHFKVKKYPNDNSGKVPAHVEISSYSFARRFLSFVWFLNDVEEGGEIRFRDISITPEKGTLIIFPPFWLFPYLENAPISNSKYLLTTYLHYK